MEGFLIFAALFLMTAVAVMLTIRREKNIALLETVTDRNRGTKSERKLVLKLLKYGFTSEQLFHDLYIEYRPGYYSQIDVVVLSPIGIIVFEDKDYSGWLFGNGAQKYWTQVLDYGNEKHRFYNPVLQNQSHIRTLISVLDKHAEDVRFIPYIVFHGECLLRNINGIPDDVIVGYARDLHATLNALKGLSECTYQDIEAIRGILKEGEMNGRNPMVIQRHIHNIERWKSN